jgi:hypothetical protein
MYKSEDSTEQIMALGLLDRLFYGSEPLDRLPKLLSSWIPSTTTREYVCDLVEVCHVTLKLLDTNQKQCADIMASEEAKQATVAVKGKSKKKKVQTNDAVLQMKMAASDFDITSYFVRKLVSNPIVFMYTKLLGQYEFNAPHVNHRIVSYFLRLAKVKIVEGDDGSQPPQALDTMKNLLSPRTTTLEPMLYNIQLLMVLNTILNDPIIRNDESYATTLAWASGIVHNFATQAARNPVLFAECLFRHPVPHRFCELSTNMYVNEELRMIAEKELLLEAQRLERLNAEDSDEDEDREQEEEVEFKDDEVHCFPPKRRIADSSSSSSDDGSDDENPPTLGKSNKKSRVQPATKTIVDIGDKDSSDDDLEIDFSTTQVPNIKSTTNVAPKTSKFKRKAFDDSSDDEELEFDFKPPVSDNVASSNDPKAARGSRKVVLDDSSDEESDSDGSGSKTAAEQETSSSISVLKPTVDIDNADDDSCNDAEAMATMPEMEKEKLRQAVLDDSSSDEEEDDAAIAAQGKGDVDDEMQD